MNYLQILLLKIDCQQEIVTRDKFHNFTQQLKVFPEYFEFTKQKFK
jgi:hypothetical protein